ncbi:LOW QUALITY PROTEIN: protein-associating with the carboxyl-terminal domain of ezrin-like [Liolophura sinensis]|uniref:LOW QUALITY PROTEIN: protein-associating with the carboxyl-terminal domain of ezrin-like n=1 Tax=Liolophura sinensis TaxID=3198878 RepID=UPI0031595B4B
MGAESSALQDSEIGELVPQAGNVNWDLHDAISGDGQDVSIFVYKKREKRDLDLLKLNSQHLKTLRHPHILRYVASGQNSDGSYLMTERVVPLDAVLSSLTFEEVVSGLRDILEALIFLHDTVKVCHNNISLAAVFVSQDGRWRLGGFEHACLFKDATREFLDLHLAYRCENAIAPEEKESSFKAQTQQGHSRDVYAFGVLADFMLELLGDVGSATKTFELIIQDECLSPDPGSRPHLRSLIDNSLFRNDFIEIQAFLKHIPLKSKQEKEDFFRSVIPKLLGLPEQLVARRLVKPLLSRFVLLDKSATAYMVPHLLTPCRAEARPTICKKGEITPVLTEQVFKSHVIPEVFKIFHVHDTHIRMVLLNNFGSFVSAFDRTHLKTSIMPQILLGVADSDDQLVAASLRALADLVLVLGGETVIGGRSKHIFTAGTPKEINERLKDLTDLKSVSKTLSKKVLLKDLATGGLSKNGNLNRMNSIHGDDLEDEKRRRDREQKQEEARLRREEKRRLLKEKKLLREITAKKQENKIVQGWNDDEEGLNKNELKENRTSLSHERRGSQGEVTDDDSEVDGEWESWDDMTGKRSNNGDSDGNISDQIENELKKMPSTISPKSPKSPGDKETSPVGSVKSASSDTKFDWSRNSQHSEDLWENDDNQEKTSSRQMKSRVLRLGSAGRKNSSGKNAGDGSHDLSVSSDSFRKNSSLKLGSSRKNKLKSTPPKPSRPLGAEFDIMEIEVKKKVVTVEAEPDFFSDMIPEIKTPVKADVRLPNTSHSKGSPVASKASPVAKPSLSFAVTQDSVTEPDGWGDEELNWDWESTEQ